MVWGQAEKDREGWRGFERVLWLQSPELKLVEGMGERQRSV